VEWQIVLSIDIGPVKNSPFLAQILLWELLLNAHSLLLRKSSTTREKLYSSTSFNQCFMFRSSFVRVYYNRNRGTLVGFGERGKNAHFGPFDMGLVVQSIWPPFLSRFFKWLTESGCLIAAKQWALFNFEWDWSTLLTTHFSVLHLLTTILLLSQLKAIIVI